MYTYSGNLLYMTYTSYWHLFVSKLYVDSVNYCNFIINQLNDDSYLQHTCIFQRNSKDLHSSTLISLSTVKFKRSPFGCIEINILIIILFYVLKCIISRG